MRSVSLMLACKHTGWEQWAELAEVGDGGLSTICGLC